MKVEGGRKGRQKEMRKGRLKWGCRTRGGNWGEKELEIEEEWGEREMGEEMTTEIEEKWGRKGGRNGGKGR